METPLLGRGCLGEPGIRFMATSWCASWPARLARAGDGLAETGADLELSPCGDALGVRLTGKELSSVRAASCSNTTGLLPWRLPLTLLCTTRSSSPADWTATDALLVTCAVLALKPSAGRGRVGVGALPPAGPAVAGVKAIQSGVLVLGADPSLLSTCTRRSVLSLLSTPPGSALAPLAALEVAAHAPCLGGRAACCNA